jgi:hypothetical protein
MIPNPLFQTRYSKTKTVQKKYIFAKDVDSITSNQLKLETDDKKVKISHTNSLKVVKNRSNNPHASKTKTS